MSEPRKPTITTAGLDPSVARVLEPVRQSIEMLTGGRSGIKELSGLPQEATLRDAIGKINEIISRLNASGTNHV